MFNFKSLIKKFPLVWPIYFNNKWKKGTIKYTLVSGKAKVDVRTVLDSSCLQIENMGKSFRGLREDDDVVLTCLKWVYNNIQYKGDIETHKVSEFWQEAPETFATKEGDCEDGAILLMKIMEAAGIPAWRRKLCAGWVKSGNSRGGHAYVIYLADDFEWYVLDWCYWGLTSIGDFKVKPQRDRKEYEEIWWTFNEKYCWVQHDTLMR